MSTLGEAWCQFAAGSLHCVNGARCPNPNHRTEDLSEMPEMKMDRFGRYLIVNPDTGVEEPFTRATTIAKTLEDTYHLGQYQQRMVAYGMGQRPDLVALASSAKSPDEKQLLNDVIRQAAHAAASSKKANLGTALHGITERIDRGETGFHVPDEYRDHITRYKAVVSAFGFHFDPSMIEVTLLNTEIHVAGTADRAVLWPNRNDGLDPETPIIADLKTGSSLAYSEVSIAQQLAIYANATHTVKDGKAVELDVPFEKRFGLVIHMPVDGDEVTVYEVDLLTGWEMVRTSLDVRDIRKTNGLFKRLAPEPTPLDASPAEEPAAEEPNNYPGGLEEAKVRVRRLIEAGHGSKISAMWQPGVPTLKQGGLSDAQIAMVHRWCETVEAEVSMPF